MTFCQWACLQKQCVVILGDLNMDRLTANRGEGKILRDLEQVDNLTCLITEPTRVTVHSQTLLDVLLTNTLEMFTRCGVYNPKISDHCLIYGEMTDKVCKHKPKTIAFRQTKARFIRRISAVSNAIETIGNEMICFIIYCLNCIRHGRNATYERVLRTLTSNCLTKTYLMHLGMSVTSSPV